MRNLLLFGVLFLVTACSGQTGEYAARGAGTGALSGAVGSMFGALVFGGDPIDAAARGAVIGAGAGATAGAIAGADADRRRAQQQQAELDALRLEIGDDTFEGLVALAECRHDEAFSQANKAVQSDNADYALAGLWLKALTLADQRRESEARAFYPDLVERDPEVGTADQVELEARQFLQELTAIRGEYGLPQICSA